jgi:superoxide dismutase
LKHLTSQGIVAEPSTANPYEDAIGGPALWWNHRALAESCRHDDPLDYGWHSLVFDSLLFECSSGTEAGILFASVPFTWRQDLENALRDVLRLLSPMDLGYLCAVVDFPSGHVSVVHVQVPICARDFEDSADLLRRAICAIDLHEHAWLCGPNYDECWHRYGAWCLSHMNWSQVYNRYRQLMATCGSPRG